MVLEFEIWRLKAITDLIYWWTFGLLFISFGKQKWHFNWLNFLVLFNITSADISWKSADGILEGTINSSPLKIAQHWSNDEWTWSGQAVMRCATAAWWCLLFCQNLGGRTPTLPTRFRHPRPNIYAFRLVIIINSYKYRYVHTLFK